MADSKKKRGGGVAALPQNVALDPDEQDSFEKKVKEIKNRSEEFGKGEGPGIVYVGHIPHGFFEHEMKSFFSQFGEINRLRISRSKKTGKIKGYAFIEFCSEEVAKIVAETMNNYLMFEKLLQCSYVPFEKVHPETFKGCDRKFTEPKASMVAIRRHNQHKSDVKVISNRKKFMKKQRKRLQTLKELGIDYMLEDVKVPKGVGKKKTAVPLSKTTPCPSSVQTPKGEIQVLKEDSSDAEISFKTPPRTVRSTRLRRTTSGSLLLPSQNSTPTRGKKIVVKKAMVVKLERQIGDAKQGDNVNTAQRRDGKKVKRLKTSRKKLKN